MDFTERMLDAALVKDAARTAVWSVGVLAAFAVVGLLFQGLPWAFASADLTPPSVSGGLHDISGPSPADLLAGTVADFVRNLAFSILPFGVGVFLVLWLLLPIPSGTSFVRTAVIGAVASLVGALLAALVGLLASGFQYAGWGALLALLSFVTVGMRQAPVVILVLVVRHLVPRRVEP